MFLVISSCFCTDSFDKIIMNNEFFSDFHEKKKIVHENIIKLKSALEVLLKIYKMFRLFIYGTVETQYTHVISK